MPVHDNQIACDISSEDVQEDDVGEPLNSKNPRRPIHRMLSLMSRELYVLLQASQHFDGLLTALSELLPCSSRLPQSSCTECMHGFLTGATADQAFNRSISTLNNSVARPGHCIGLCEMDLNAFIILDVELENCSFCQVRACLIASRLFSL